MKKEIKQYHINVVSQILGSSEFNLSEEQKKSLNIILEEFEKDNAEIDYLKIAVTIAKIVGVGVEIYDKFKT